MNLDEKARKHTEMIYRFSINVVFSWLCLMYTLSPLFKSSTIFSVPLLAPNECSSLFVVFPQIGPNTISTYRHNSTWEMVCAISSSCINTIILIIVVPYVVPYFVKSNDTSCVYFYLKMPRNQTLPMLTPAPCIFLRTISELTSTRKDAYCLSGVFFGMCLILVKEHILFTNSDFYICYRVPSNTIFISFFCNMRVFPPLPLYRNWG